MLILERFAISEVNRKIAMKTKVFSALVLGCLMTVACFSQTAVILAPIPVFQSFLQNGKPNAFGCVFTYASQTTTPISSWTDFTGTTLNQNPVVLQAGGTANIWIQAGISYTLVIKSSGGVNCVSGSTVSTVNGIGGGGSVQTTAVIWSSTPTFIVTAQNQLFTITLQGNTASLPLSVVGIVPPGYITFQITQDGIGGHTFAWPANVIGGGPIGLGADQVTTQMFLWNGTNATAIGPAILGNGPLMSGLLQSGSTPASTGTVRLSPADHICWRDSTNTVNNCTSGTLKNTTVVTQTGDTAPHTIYTIPIPGGAMPANGQMRISLYVLTNVVAGNPTVNIYYGGTRITAAATIGAGIGNANGLYHIVVGGNLGTTNSQSWDETAAFLLGTVSPGNIYHNTSAIDSTVNQNITVVYQGGANSDSITFYRIIVEFL